MVNKFFMLISQRIVPFYPKQQFDKKAAKKLVFEENVLLIRSIKAFCAAPSISLLVQFLQHSDNQ